LVGTSTVRVSASALEVVANPMGSRRGHHAADVDDAVADREARRALRQELAETIDGGVDTPGVTSPFEARRGLGPQAQPLGCAGDGHGSEVGRLEQHLGGSGGDLRRRAAHDPRHAHRHVLGVADEAVGAAVPHGPGHTVERLDRLTGFGTTDDEAAPPQPLDVIGMGGLPELEHHVVRRVDHVVDRSHAGQGEAIGDPPGRRAHDDVAEHRDGQAGAEVEVLHRGACGVADRLPAWRRGRRFGQGEGEPEPGRQVTGDARHAPGVGPVALHRDVEDGVLLQAERIGQQGSGGGDHILAQHEESGAVVGEAELPSRAQHPVGGDPPHFATAYLEPTG
jgi:hypothetical protein